MAQEAQFGFFVSQLAHVEPEVLMIQYADIQYPDLIPVDDSAWDWAPQITWFSGDGTGEPKEIANAGDDIPLAQLSRDIHQVDVSMFALGFGYTEADIQSAMRVGTNLSSEQAMNVRRLVEEKIEDIIWEGDTRHQWESFLNSSLVTNQAAAFGDGGMNASNRLWTNKTATEILKDINTALSGVRETTSRVEMADTLCLPPAACDLLSWMHLPQTDRSLWSYIMENNVYTNKTGRQLSIYEINELDTAGPAVSGTTERTEGGEGTGRMIAYRRSPDVLKFHMPMPFSFFNPRMENSLKYLVDGIFRTGGLEIRRPGAMRYIDGISFPVA